MGGVGSQEITRSGQTVIARLMEMQHGSVGVGFSKGTMASASCLEESCTPTLTLMPDTSVPPCMPLVPFRLLPQCWSSKEMSSNLCIGPLRGTPGTLEALCLSQEQSPLVFTATGYGNFSFWHWNPGLWDLVWDWYPWLLRGGPPQPRYLPNFYPPHVDAGPAYSHLCPSYQSHCGFFFNSLVSGLPFCQISGDFE